MAVYSKGQLTEYVVPKDGWIGSNLFYLHAFSEFIIALRYKDLKLASLASLGYVSLG